MRTTCHRSVRVGPCATAKVALTTQSRHRHRQDLQFRRHPATKSQTTLENTLKSSWPPADSCRAKPSCDVGSLAVGSGVPTDLRFAHQLHLGIRSLLFPGKHRAHVLPSFFPGVLESAVHVMPRDDYPPQVPHGPPGPERESH